MYATTCIIQTRDYHLARQEEILRDLFLYLE